MPEVRLKMKYYFGRSHNSEKRRFGWGRSWIVDNYIACPSVIFSRMFFPPCFVFTTAGIVNLSRASVYVPAAVHSGRWPKRVPLPVGCQCFPCCSLSLIVLTLARSLSLSLVGVLSFGLCRNQKSNSILFAGVPVLLSWPVLVFTNRREIVVWLTHTHNPKMAHERNCVWRWGPTTHKQICANVWWDAVRWCLVCHTDSPMPFRELACVQFQWNIIMAQMGLSISFILYLTPLCVHWICLQKVNTPSFGDMGCDRTADEHWRPQVRNTSLTWYNYTINLLESWIHLQCFFSIPILLLHAIFLHLLSLFVPHNDFLEFFIFYVVSIAFCYFALYAKFSTTTPWWVKWSECIGRLIPWYTNLYTRWLHQQHPT